MIHKKILIADEMHQSIISLLQENGFEPDYQPHIKRNQMIEKINDYEGLIIRSKTKIDLDFLKNCVKLKFIGRAGAGLDLIDIEEVRRKNITIFAANEGNKVAVAEHTIGMLLCLFNRINIADHQVRNKDWKREENRGIELAGKKVGIIGYGNNGKETAKRFWAFGCEVLAYDKYLENFGDLYAKEAMIDEIFEKADILSLHFPLTETDKRMINNDFLKKFKKDIYLINIARGELVDLEDLVKNLISGKVKGACLDVLENEKIESLTIAQQKDFDFLIASENTILTPHIAGWTHESYRKINEVLVEKINDFYKAV